MLKNRFIVITGANGNVGSQLAKTYHMQGARLLLLYHNRTDRIKDLLKEPRVLSRPIDLMDLSSLEQYVKSLGKEHSSNPDSLIHCASVRAVDAKTLSASIPSAWTDTLLQNVLGFYNVLHTFLPSMQENRFGRVVVFGSNVSQKGLAYGSAYAAAKAAMVNMIRSVSLENEASNICLNAISPGPLDTCLEEDYSGEYLAFRKNYFTTYVNNNPTKGLCKISELIAICDMLLSADLSHSSGLEILL